MAKNSEPPWQKLADLAGAAAPALFLGRLVPEATGRPWPWLATLACTATLVALVLWLTARLRKPGRRPGWPLLLLLLYLPYPYPDWRVAAGVAALSLAVYIVGSPACQVRPAQHLWVDAAIFFGFLLLYVPTLAGDVLPADNGEFQLVAALLGVAHPPGYALHTMLGWLMSRLPIGTLPWRVNLLSALLAAGTLALVSATVRRLTGRAAAGVATAAALGTSTTFWAQATMSNVRTPAAFFTALCVYSLALHSQDRKHSLPLFVASFTLGLTHHLSLAFIGLLFVVYLLLIDPSLIRRPRRWRRPALAAFLCLLPLLYLPLRAGAPLAPENIATPTGFVRHVLALGFSGDFFYFSSAADLLARLRVMGNVLAFQFHPLVLVGGAAGAIILLRKDRRLALLLVGGFALHTLVTATYRAPQTVEYMLPAYVLLALTLGYGLGQIPLGSPQNPLYALSAALLIGVAVLQAISHFPSFRALAQDQDTRAYATPILESAPQGAIVLADLHWAMPLRYLQLVEGARPDLTIQYVAPTAERYEETFARRIREELPSRPVVTTHFHELAYADIPAVFEPLGEAFLVRSEARRELPDGFTPAEVTFGDALSVLGSEVDSSPSTSAIIVTLAWSPLASESRAPVSLYAHLVGRDGGLYAQQDRVLDTRFVAAGEIGLTRFQLEPRPGALAGRYSLQIGAYRTPAEPLLTASGESRVELLAWEVGPASSPLYTRRPRFQPLQNGLVLTGVDWDLTLVAQPRLYLHWQARRDTTPFTFGLSEASVLDKETIPALPAGARQTTVHTLTELPGRLTIVPDSASFAGPWAIRQDALRLPIPRTAEQYLPFGSGIIYLGTRPQLPGQLGKRLSPRLVFLASRPVQRDYAVSVALIGLYPDNTWVWREADDGIPALGAIPTLKWTAGSRVNDPRELSVPPDAPAGQVIGTLTLYDAFTGRTLPLLDERLAALAPWAPLGSWTLQP